MQAPRRGIGLAVFVIIVLLIATITLSLFLRQQPPSGEGLSLEDGAGSRGAERRLPSWLTAADCAAPAPAVVRHLIVTSAIVLRRVAYGEADLVVTLLGLDTGRVSALARAARKSSRRFAGGLEPGLGR